MCDLNSTPPNCIWCTPANQCTKLHSQPCCTLASAACIHISLANNWDLSLHIDFPSVDLPTECGTPWRKLCQCGGDCVDLTPDLPPPPPADRTVSVGLCIGCGLNEPGFVCPGNSFVGSSVVCPGLAADWSAVYLPTRWHHCVQQSTSWVLRLWAFFFALPLPVTTTRTSYSLLTGRLMTSTSQCPI